jgi:deoxyribonuclease-4
MPLLGAHVSIAGGLAKAFARGRAIGCEALQIFVKSPQQWRGKPLNEQAVADFQEAHAQCPLPVVAHSNYLINLAATNSVTLERSRAALADELSRCEALGIAELVLHPGAHMGAGEEAGVERVARSLEAVFARYPCKTRVLLENTAGQGTVLGYRLEHLQGVLERVDAPERLGVCLDTCHAFAAGYALHEARSYTAWLEEVGHTVGWANVACFHLNDSKFPLGSRKDRHANIGMGEMGLAAFARIISEERFKGLPMILETPVGEDGLGHKRDLERLRAL